MRRADTQAGEPEPLPGQMAFPGWEPEPGLAPDDGQLSLPGLDAAVWPDTAIDRVAAALRVADPDGSRMAAAIRRAFDLLLDGQHTG
ncbi:MAG TPA: NaeI family type II restriction endonuclease, partial [Streptosporangiaceae bacterium]|nr:NaeI family type II restriction endonuclease [Streptosporangiaceae bacterium]